MVEKTKQKDNKNKRSKTKINLNYSVGDFLVRVKNTAMAGNKEAKARRTKLVVAVAEALKRTGVLREIRLDKDDPNQFSVILAYSNKMPVFTNIKIVSKPGLRVYVKTDQLAKHKKPSTLIISTPFGILTSREALKENCGGEVIAEIY